MKAIARALVVVVAIASVARARLVFAPDPTATEHVRLRNGLHVILAPDSTASSVVVHVRYESGAAVERASEAGYTKLLEKLMSAGSVHVKDFDARIEAAGGWSTATATSDYLAVTEQVPAHALDLVLWLEAERMAGLPDGMTADGVAAARNAVYGEWRAAYVDEPYALVTRELQQTLWTGKFATQGLPVLGDGQAAHVADIAAVRRFARERLVPNNAVVVVAGRFAAADARRLVERYFGWIPTRETVTGRGDLFVEPRPSAAEVTVKDPVAKVVVAARCEPNDAEIDVVARLLAARAQRLVATGLASEVSVDVVRQRAAELRLQATPTTGGNPEALAAAMRDTIATLHAQPPDLEELARAIATADRELLLAYENVAVRAELLATWNTIAVGTLGDKRARLQRVTPDSVERTWQRWLRPPALVTVIGRPEGP